MRRRRSRREELDGYVGYLEEELKRVREELEEATEAPSESSRGDVVYGL